MSKTWISRVAAALAVLSMGASTAFAMAGTKVGTVVLPNNVAPIHEELSFVAFINGTDDVIHTENAYNAALGTKNGYTLQNNRGLWLVNFSNFHSAKPGDNYSVIFTSQRNLRGVMNASVPSGLTQSPEAVALRPVNIPATPTNLSAQRTSAGVAVNWAAQDGLTYRVYRADLPSGAANGASRGIYEKVAEGVETGSFVDTKADGATTYWYLVIAENKNGVLSGHSGEVRALEPNITRPDNQLTIGTQGLLMDMSDLEEDGENLDAPVRPRR